MSKTKIAAVALSALVLAGSLAIGATEAQAKGGKKAFAIGLGAAALVGAAAAATYDYPAYYGYGYRRCHWEPRFNYYGDVIGRVRVCDVY